jgi:hypothetical protein
MTPSPGLIARSCLAWLVLFAVGWLGVAETVFHVSPQGKDTNPGTRNHPFASLQRAREAVRKADRTQGCKVVVAEGVYEQRETLVLGSEDSGVYGRPVRWEAARGATVRLIGGRSLPLTAFQPVKDAAVLKRIPAVAQGKVVVADLRAAGVEGVTPYPVAFHGAPAGAELFLDSQRMRLARWPNTGWATIARILEPGSRPRDGDQRGLTGSFEYSGDQPSRWSAADGVWLQGYWCYDWYDEVIQVKAIDPAAHRITLAAPHVYGLIQGNPSPRRYRALNVLEELDEPGEFVMDFQRGSVYFWPPPGKEAGGLVLSTLDAPILALRGASHVTLRGFTVECGLDLGIEIQGGKECAIEACEVRNLRQMGIRVSGGTLHRVADCRIHDTGTGGLFLGGGDRRTLTPALHEASNNHIWNFSVHQLTSAYGLAFEGVGNRALHNLIHDAPHQAVFVGGNDHLFQYNEVHHVCTETDDCGALYKGRNPSCRGNIIRWNYWHDIGSPMGHGNAAVYFDDGDGGDLVYGNVFVRCGDPGRGSFGTVFSHGGHGIRAENNIFVDCKRALGSAPWDDPRWRAALRGAEETFFPEKLTQEVDITSLPYTARYPELIGFLNPPENAPRSNFARRNLMVGGGEASNGNWQMTDTLSWPTGENPGFVNPSTADYRLRKDAPVFRKMPGFQYVPFEKIGLRKE